MRIYADGRKFSFFRRVTFLHTLCELCASFAALMAYVCYFLLFL